MTARITSCLGLLLPPLAWALSVELGLVLPPVDCAAESIWSLFATATAAIVALLGALVSHRAAGRAAGRMGAFLGEVSALSGLAFAFAILLQGAAAWGIHPCLR